MKKIYNKAVQAITSVSGVSCLFICFCITAQIFCRTFLGISLKWSEELAQVAIIMMVFLALTEVERNNEHLKVEILFSVFPKLAKSMNILGSMLTILYASIIVYSGFLMLPAVKKATAKASGFPIRFIYYAMLLGVVLWIVQAAINLIEHFKRKEGGES
ncbi:MAG: TRAP transporter small permease [Candidatus Fimivivens sp.]|nr:TRAP transporter small permease [Candidatus Fimivivens sp.]